MRKTRSISYKIHGIERQICISFMIFSFVLLGLYIYFVGESIINVLVREEIELHIAEVNSRLSTLESDYITQKSTISMAFAVKSGFKSISRRTFINRDSFIGRSLTQRNEI